MKKKGWSQEEIRAITGLSINTIAQVFQGKRISLNTADRISVAFGTNREELFDIVGSGGLSPKTIKEYHNLLHAMFRYCLAEGGIVRNPADLGRLPRREKKEASFLEISEVKRVMELLKSEPVKYRIMVSILIETGIRRGELLALKWESVDLAHGVLLINSNLLYDPGKLEYCESFGIDPVKVYIHSEGGDIDDCLMILDEIQVADMRVIIVCVGYAAGMAAIILAAGQKGRRYILSNAGIMIPQRLLLQLCFQYVIGGYMI